MNHLDEGPAVGPDQIGLHHTLLDGQTMTPPIIVGIVCLVLLHQWGRYLWSASTRMKQIEGDDHCQGWFVGTLRRMAWVITCLLGLSVPIFTSLQALDYLQ